LNHGAIFFPVGVKSRDAGEGGRGVGGFGKVFIAIQANRNSDFRVGVGGI
jgi:hypothetical protein